MSTSHILAKQRAQTAQYYDSEEWKIRCHEEAPDQYAFTPIFKQLASLNIFILDSQSGHTNRGRGYMYKQRSYILAFAPKKYVAFLVEHINLNTDHIAMRVGVTKIDADNRITVTKQRTGNDRKWRTTTRLDTSVPVEEFNHAYRERFGSTEDVTKFDMFQVVDSTYSRKGKLYKDVLKCAKEKQYTHKYS